MKTFPKIRRKLCYLCEVIRKKSNYSPLHTDIDIIIPVCEKDLAILPLCLEGVKNCICHHIAAIYIISPDSEETRTFCTKHQLHFINEKEVLGYTPKEREPFYAGNPKRDRTGWIFQQLLKLSGKIGKSPYFIVIDADHILLQPHTFITPNRKLVFYQSVQYHEPYYTNIERLTGKYPHTHLSYIAHKMVFERELLADLRKQIELHHFPLKWDEAIWKSLDSTDISAFSEFELFGNFVPIQEKVHLPWLQKSFSYGECMDYESLRKKHASKFRSITFPSFKKDK